MGFSALGRVAELADALDLGSSGVTRAGSIPVSPTEQLIEGSDRFGDGLGLCFFLSMRLVYASCLCVLSYPVCIRFWRVSPGHHLFQSNSPTLSDVAL